LAAQAPRVGGYSDQMSRYAADNSPNKTLTFMTYSIEFTKRAPRTSHSFLPMASALSSYFLRCPLDI
jgi:hypothetical protein